MNKKIIALVFSLPFVLLLLWTGTLCIQRAAGTEVRVSVQGYDPRDLLSGHYIAFTIDWNTTDCAQFSNNVCPKDEFCSWGQQCRFYIPEKNAKELDLLFARRGVSNDVFEVIYSYKKGAVPVAKKLLINGKDWRESIKE